MAEWRPPMCMSPMSAATTKKMMTSRVKKEPDPMVYNAKDGPYRMSEDDKKSRRLRFS
jgi:hypothetical protein